MKRLKNILIIFICFLMLCSFTNDETAPLEYVQSFDQINSYVGYTSAYPTSYDSRVAIDTFNNQTNENQKNLNICWAFASNNVLEAYMKKVKSYTVNYSENQPEYVARYLGDISSFGNANNTFNVVKYLFYNITPIDETTFDSSGYFTTYKEKELKSYMSTSSVGIDVQKLKLFNQYPVQELLNGSYTETQIYDSIAKYNEKVKEYVYKYGSVMGIIHTDFMTKTYDGSYGWCYNNGSKAESEYKSSAHAITIIGWDDNYVWQGNNPAPYKGAWLAANSWGTGTTFFYISYFDVSIVKGFLGVSSININNNFMLYNNSYLVAESSKFANSYKDNREKYYTRTNTANTTESFTYYIGDNTEKLVSAKLLFFGFSNSQEAINNLQVKIEVIGPDDSTFNTTTIEPGITGFSLRGINLSGTIKVNVTITNPTNLKISNMYYAVELYTKNSNTSKTLYINSKNNSYTNLVNSSTKFDVVTKNIETTPKSNITVKVLDSSSNDITSKFNITKSDLVFNSISLNLLQKEALSTSSITLKVTAGGVTSSKTLSSSSPSYSFNNYSVDETNKIVKYISPKTTVSTLISNVNGGVKTVTDKNGNVLSNSSYVNTGNKLKIVINNNTYTYDLSVLGNVNSDNNIDINDVMKVATHSIKGGKLTTQLELYSADVTKDGKININDVMKIATYSIKGVGL